MIDITKIKLGDEVTVRGRVCTIDVDNSRAGGAGVAIREQWFTPERILTHTPIPREFKPGDHVTWGDGLHIYEFIAQRGNSAIVWHSEFGVEDPYITNLRHVDESP